MAELARSGHHETGNNGSSKAHLRAQLQLLRSEQMGESSNGDDEDGEVEEEDAVDGQESGDMEDAATAAVNAKRRDAVVLASGSGDDGEEEQGSEDSSEEDQGEEEKDDDYGNCSKDDATVNGRASGRKAKGGGDNVANDGGDGPTSSGMEDEGGGQRGVSGGQSRNHTQGGEGSEMEAVVDDTWVRHVGQELDAVELAVLAAAEQVSRRGLGIGGSMLGNAGLGRVNAQFPLVQYLETCDQGVALSAEVLCPEYPPSQSRFHLYL